MKKNLLLVSILAAATAIVACDDNDKEIHSEGAVRCNINSAGIHFSEQWTGGEWKTNVICGAGNACVDGDCLSTDNSCNDATYASRCVQLPSDRDVQTSSGNTVVQASILQYCANGEIKQTNCRLLGGQVCLGADGSAYCGDDEATLEAANAECENGETRCNLSGEHQVCAGSKWVNDPCSGGTTCVAGECKKPSTTCTDGAKKCDGKDAYVCSNYAWQKTETCDGKCFAGNCVAADYVPTVGEDCGDIDVFCEGTTYLYCSNTTHKLVGDECVTSDGNQCITQADGSEECAYLSSVIPEFGGTACKYEGQIALVEDYSDHYDGVILFMECVKNVNDGKLYGVVDIAYAVCDGKNLIKLGDNGDITITQCSESCVEYPAHMSAQCEVNGKRENIDPPVYCNEAGDACLNGVASSETLDFTWERCPELDSQCASQFGSDHICVAPVGSRSGYCMETCSGNETETECSSGLDTTASGQLTVAGLVSVSECQSFSDGTSALIPTRYDDCAATGNGGNGGNGGNDNPGGDTPSGEACDFYDCSNLYGSQCQSQYGVSGALCDDESAYCLEREASLDGQCDDSGLQAWCQDDEHCYCLAIGTDESCLDAGGSDQPSTGDFVYAGDEECYLSSTSDETAPCSQLCGSNYPGTDAVAYGDSIYCVDTCTSEGAETTVCVDSSTYGAYEAVSVCTDLDGHLLDLPISDKDCESEACNSDLTACADALTADQGEACTPSTRSDKCEGNILSYCNSSGVVAAADCAKYDLVCDSVDNAGTDYADCFAESDCTEVGSEILMCDTYYGTIDTKICRKSASTGNTYYVLQDYETCDFGCEDGDTSCPLPLVDDQGEECDSTERQGRCDGDIMSYCDDSSLYAYFYGASVVAEDCSKSNTVCADPTIDDVVAWGCYEKCSTPGAVRYSCDDSYGSSYDEYYVDIYHCVETDKGNFWVYEDYDVCDGICSSIDNDISDCGIDDSGNGGNGSDTALDCTGKADGAYCADIDGDITSYVCDSGELVTEGWGAPVVCSKYSQKCHAVAGAAYPVCGDCSTDADCASGETCNDDAECVAGGNSVEAPTIDAFCAQHGDGATACYGTVQYACDDSYGNEAFDCKAENASYGSACVIDDDGKAWCGCNTDADCTNAAYGSICVVSEWYDGISQCGCESDNDCAAGKTCNTSVGWCL